MKWFGIKIIFLLSLALFVSYSIGEGASRPETGDSIKKISVPFVKGNSMRIVIVGDTGTGERAYAQVLGQCKKQCAKPILISYCIWVTLFIRLGFFLNPVRIDILKKSKRHYLTLIR